MLDLFFQVITKPKFDAENVDFVRAEQMARMQDFYTEPRAISERVFQRAIFV